MSTIYLFNPENDMALANGSPFYMTPASAKKMAADLSVLPVWYADDGSDVWLSDIRQKQWLEEECPIRLKVNGTLQPETIYNKVLPWGWNLALLHRLQKMGMNEAFLPSDERLKDIRKLSSRRTAVDLLIRLKEQEDVGESFWITSVEEVEALLICYPKLLLKAPWSSSGKGIQPVNGLLDDSIIGWIRRIIRSQEGVVAEPFYEKVIDFALEYRLSENGITFVGYSLFEADARGIYKENRLASDAAIENMLASFIPIERIQHLRERLLEELALLADGVYQGYAGVDMMIVRTADGYALHPCVEVNWRMNMGVLSRLFFDKYVSVNSEGRYWMEYYAQPGEAVRFHERMQQAYPLQLEGERIKEGYLSLTPVFEDTAYQAYVIVKKNLSR